MVILNPKLSNLKHQTPTYTIKLFNLDNNDNIRVWQATLKLINYKSKKIIPLTEMTRNPDFHFHKDLYVELEIKYGLYPNGKMTTTKHLIKEGKNLGKANQTNVYTQALIELNSLINKKKDQGYLETASQIKKRNRFISPMLAMDYRKAGHRIKYPAYLQPKLDGIRVLAMYNPDTNPPTIELISRKNNKFQFLDHIRKELLSKKLHKKIAKLASNIPKNKRPSSIYIDGELYSDELPFQLISSAVRKTKSAKLTKEDKQNQLHIKIFVFDFFHLDNLNLPYKERKEILKQSFGKLRWKHLELVPTEVIKSGVQLRPRHDHYVKEGYEGVILRNVQSPYKFGPSRSPDLQKYKSFMDAEFKVVDIEQAKGRDTGTAIFVCQTNSTKTRFRVRPTGSFEYRKSIWENREDYIGKYITVRFFDYTTRQVNGKTVQSDIPLMPSTNGILRNYE